MYVFKHNAKKVQRYGYISSRPWQQMEVGSVLQLPLFVILSESI